MATAIQEHMAHAPGMNAAMAHLAANLRAATVEVKVENLGAGSGVIWRDDGLIVTNNHVVRGDTAEIVLWDGRTFQGKVVDRSAEFDLASLRIEAHDLQAAPIGDSSRLRVGALVLAMGNPLGVKGALTVGIVHMVPSGRDGSSEDRWIRADLSLLPGNSGGPMVDAVGRVIGVNSMVAGGLALAIPSNTVARFIAGNAGPAYLGVVVQPVELSNGFATLAARGQTAGLMVLSIRQDSPAARGGLLPGDILIHAGRRTLAGDDALMDVLYASDAGTPLPLTIIRGGKLTEVTVILGKREADQA
jgi:serine protease Do